MEPLGSSTSTSRARTGTGAHYERALDIEYVDGLFAELEARVLGLLAGEELPHDQARLQRMIDMRYRRQVHILTVPVIGDASRATSCSQRRST